jgi:hypothetical protein
MFEGLKHNLKVRRLTTARNKLQAEYSKDYNAAKAIHDEDQMQKIYAEQCFETQTIDDEIGFLLTQYWTSKADRLYLPKPPFSETDGTWVHGETNGLWQLSRDEIDKLRSAVRKVEKENREHWQVWATLAIGFMGTLIGLVALLTK